MNNKEMNSQNRRRDVLTPAQRKAEQKRKSASLNKKTDTASYAKPTPNQKVRTVEDKKQPSGSPRYNGNRSQSSATTESRLKLQQQQLLEQQKQIEMLQKQIHAEKEQRTRQSQSDLKLRELERKIEQQKLINESYMEDKNKPLTENAKKNLRIAAITTIIILTLATIIAFSKITTNTIPQKPQNDASESTHQPVPSTGDTQSNIPLVQPEDTKNEKVSIFSQDFTQGSLSLINKEYSYMFDYTGSDITNGELTLVAAKIPNNIYKASDYTVYLNAETIDMFNLMMKDFYAFSGKTDVMVNTAHRTYEQQKSIYDAKIKQLGAEQQIAQTPGNSEHHSGYAFDLAIYPPNANGSTFINAEPYTWIYENCHKYGFILRYPEGKTAITGISPESWHFRYVGVPHASYMASKNKTLEEYITDISIYSEDIPLKIEISETESYSVFFVKKSDGARTEFSIPKNTEYKISGNNVDGFIVWYNNDDVGKKGVAEQTELIATNADTTSTNEQ